MQRPRLDAWRPDAAGSTQALAAEALGTFLLVLASAGAGSSFGSFGGVVGGAQAALAPGLTLAALILVFGPVSGGLFNPALSLGMGVAGRLPKTRVLPYVAVQCGGALAAGLVLRVLLRSSLLGVSATQMNPLAALLFEALLAFWLQWVYLAAAERAWTPAAAALAVACTVSGGILWAGPLSGAAMNPARALGPALAAWEFSNLWVYLVGPMAGAWAAALAYGWFRSLESRA